MSISEQKITEIADRARRIESKVTQMMEHFDMPTGGETPTFVNGTLYIPTPAVSLRACLKALGDEPDVVDVRCNGEFYCVIGRPE